MRGFNLSTAITWMGTLLIVYLAIFKQSVLTGPMKEGFPDAWICSFFKFFFLGTLGEIFGLYNAEKRWDLDHWLSRSLVWGFFGIWIAIAFKVFSFGVEGAISVNYIPDWGRIFTAFTKSIWINLMGGYAFFMMLSHDYFNNVIKSNWRIWSIKEFCRDQSWYLRVPFLLSLIVFFWILAHFLTFLAPPAWTVLIAAGYSAILGYTLSAFKARKQKT